MKYIITLWIIGIALLVTAWAAVPLPNIPKAKHAFSDTQPCVEPLAVIRRYHGVFLTHKRDDTMHLGIRTPQHSLVQCVDCHVTAGVEPHFCDSCHTYAAVQIDCFGCHRAVPEE